MQIMVDSIEAGLKDKSIDAQKIDCPLQTALFLRGSLHGVILLQDQDGSALLDKIGINKHQLVKSSIRQLTDSLRPSYSNSGKRIMLALLNNFDRHTTKKRIFTIREAVGEVASLLLELGSPYLLGSR